MAIELITGKAGTPHISSADVGAFNAGLFGAGNYILNGCNCTINSATSINVSAGEALCEGRHWRITGAGENLTIQNGASGYKRNDIVAAHYTRNSSGVEAVTLVVIKGTPSTGAQADPAMPNTGKVLEGASDAYWPLYRVTLDGLTPQTPVLIAEGNPSVNAETIAENQDKFRSLLGLGALATKDGITASEVTSGTLADARIPNLNASKITAGTLPITRGGTGATTAKAARSGIGMKQLWSGTATDANITLADVADYSFILFVVDTGTENQLTIPMTLRATKQWEGGAAQIQDNSGSGYKVRFARGNLALVSGTSYKATGRYYTYSGNTLSLAAGDKLAIKQIWGVI